MHIALSVELGLYFSYLWNLYAYRSAVVICGIEVTLSFNNCGFRPISIAMYAGLFMELLCLIKIVQSIFMSTALSVL